MLGLVAARAAAARGISSWVRHIGRVWGHRRLRDWLIPPTTRRDAGWLITRSEGRLAVALAPAPNAVRPVVQPYSRGTSRPEAAAVWWSSPVPATLDSTVFGPPVSPLHSRSRRVFMLIALAGALMIYSPPAFGQCCGSGCGSPCGSSCGSGCGMGPSMCGPSCCPSGGCGFGCSSGCGCPRPTFGFGLFGGGRCCSACGSCCAPPCGRVCGAPCGPVCVARCAPMCGPCCGSPWGGGPCGYSPCCGSSCGGPACGLACGPSPCGVGPCASGCCGSCEPGCAGGPSQCGAGCGPPPTYEASPGPPAGSTSGPGYPPAANPGEPIPGIAPTPIPKRPAPPQDEKGTRFERRPVGAIGSSAAPDLTDNSELATEPSATPRRLFRQSLSAGFHTTVLTAQVSRATVGSRVAQSAPRKTRLDDELARRE